MAKPNRLNIKGGLFHVMNHGNEQLAIFESADDKRFFENRFFYYSKLFEVDIIAYSIMPNHFHLFVRTNHPNLSKFMLCLQCVYAMYYNRVYLHRGHVFRDRFKSVFVGKRLYIKELSRYIHLNPVNTRLISELPFMERVNYLQQQSHGSLESYYLNSPSKEIPNFRPDIVLNLFGKSAEEQLTNYWTYLMEGMKLKPGEVSEKISSQVLSQTIYGNLETLEQVRELLKRDHNNPHSRRLTALSCKAVKRGLAYIPSIKLEDLKRGRYGKISVRDCAIYIASQLTRGKESKTKIGQAFGNLHISSVSRIVKNVEKEKHSNPDLSNFILLVEEALKNRNPKHLKHAQAIF